MSSPVREDRDGSTAGVPVALPRAPLDSYVEKGEVLTASKHEAAPKMSLPSYSCSKTRSQAEHLVDRPRMHIW